MAVYRRTSRPRFTLLLLVLTAVTLLTLDERSNGLGVVDAARDGARDLFAPVKEAADATFSPVVDFLDGALHHGDLKAENERLRDQLSEREATVLRAADAEREREALLDLAELDFVGDIPAVAARVVLTPASGFDVTLRIDKGRDAGIAKGMPVVSGGGLVGRVIDVSRKRATVRLVTDSSSSVGVRISSTGDLAVAAGRGTGSTLRVDLVDPATEVAKGEIVVTSGLQNSAFPPGIPVGKVVAANTAAGALQQDVTIEPVVDLRRITFVKVLLWGPVE